MDDLDREYQLAWEEIGQAPAADVHDLASRYVVERREDVRVFSVALARANAATRLQIRRAVQLGEQALAVVAPAEAPAPQPTPDNGVNSGGAPGNHQDQGGQGEPSGKPADAGPKATPESNPADAGPKATPESKPDNAGPNPKPRPKPGHGK